MSRCVFISGTDTDVGKTVVSALLCKCLADRELRVGYYKPVQSGGLASADRSRLLAPDCQLVSQLAPQALTRCSYTFELPAAPQLAAELSSPPVTIDVHRLDRDYCTLRDRCDVVIVEGAGGLAVPLSPQLTVSDLPHRWKLPVILVSRPTLGTINHTTLSIAYIRQLQLQLLAVTIAYQSPDLDPRDPILCDAPRSIAQLNGRVPLYRIPYVQLQDPHWDQIGETLAPLMMKVLAVA